MSYFAVLCRNGEEFELEYLIDKIDNKKVKQMIKKIISPAIIRTKITSNSPSKNRVNSSLGYVFIKVAEETSTISNDLYHFLKSIPFVQKIIPEEIPENEVRDFCENVGTDIDKEPEEAHIVDSQVVIETKEEHERTLSDSIKHVNQIKIPKERKKAEKHLEQEMNTPSCVTEKMLRTIQKGKKKGLQYFKTITITEKVHKDQKRVSFHMPHSIFANALKPLMNSLHIKDFSEPKYILDLICQDLQNRFCVT
ncbi:hypothetical protein [Bacillus piscicola]|uniref:hypothetical protein n=1 Tax=Bacillus piscicola TaxID=1632684 RepID=UPI001F09306E|nr:hypothetical protein [Bacillus piscicola]